MLLESNINKQGKSRIPENKAIEEILWFAEDLACEYHLNLLNIIGENFTDEETVFENEIKEGKEN